MAATSSVFYNATTTNAHYINSLVASTASVLNTLNVGTTTGMAGKIARFVGDIDVTGTIDPTRILFSNLAGVDSPSYNPSANGNKYLIEFAEGGDLGFNSSSTQNILFLKDNGNMGFGTSTPLGNWHFAASTSNALMLIQNDARTYGFKVRDFGTGDDRFVIFDQTANAERLFIQPSGDATFNHALTVNGAGLFNNTLTVQNTTTLNNTLTVAGFTRVNNSAKVTGDLSVDGNLESNSLELKGTRNFNNPNASAFLGGDHWYHYFNGGDSTGCPVFCFGGDGNSSGGNTDNYSVFAQGNIVSPEFRSFSDERIKNVIDVSTSSSDLKTLNKIKVTDYTLKDDKLYMGDEAPVYKKVIAQELENVTTNIVKKGHGLINIDPKKVEFRSEGTSTEMYIDNNKYTGTTTYEYVHENGSHGEWSNQKNSSVATGSAYIIKQYVEDFRTVDYDAIAVLNVSATQEIYKLLKTGSGITEVNASSSTSSDLKVEVDAVMSENLRTPVDFIKAKIDEGYEAVKDFTALKVTAVRGYFEQIFAKEVTTELLCVGNTQDKFCIQKDQLQRLIETQNSVNSATTSSL